jgi:integrase
LNANSHQFAFFAFPLAFRAVLGNDGKNSLPAMPRIPTLEPVYAARRKRWIVDVSASKSASGKRYKCTFKTRDAAREYIDRISLAEGASPAIPAPVAMEADKARAILAEHGLDIVQAAREVSAALEALNGSGTILEACKAYRLAHVARTASKPMSEAVAAFMLTREDLRDSTRKSYEYTLERTFRPLAETNLADITTDNLEAILAEKGATARAMHRRTLGVFWRWAAKPPRQWCEMAVVEALEAPRVSSDNDIEILRPDAVRALLKAAEATSPAAAIAFAIAIFAGVRMAELTRLQWGAIGADYIEIGKGVAKKHSRRLIPICKTLREWIGEYRGDAKDDDGITPNNWREVSSAVRRAAGWDVAARLLSDPPPATRGPWPANACRHTCASVQVAVGTPLDDLVFKFGHSGGTDLLRRHYVSRLTKKDALAILAAGPKGRKIQNLEAA